MKNNKLLPIASLKIVSSEETKEIADIIREAVLKKYSISLEDTEDAGCPSITLAVDSSLEFKSYSIDVSCEKESVTLIAGNLETLYYAAQRLIRSHMGETPYLEDLHIDTKVMITSDPSILCHDGKYYLCSFVCTYHGGNANNGYEIYVSDNMYDWGEPIHAFNAQECTNPAFDGISHYWAPEIWEYKGKFYIFATYFSEKSGHRGCAIFRCDKPDGKYELITNGHLTPSDWDCIDNTLYVDENGDPWMVFVHEWTSMPDHIGSMCACRLTDDLTAFEGEITTLFYANDAPWNPKNNVTDGPFVHRFESGKLAMIWSGWISGEYCIGVAYSDNGILGPWVQQEECVFARGIGDYRYGRDGGHGFMFRDADGRLMITFHGPIKQKNVYCIEVDTTGDVIKLKN
ncbi:MAG: family 43 glycosylhydrolase [Clostridia bacterium]|nr:family 43 glycosylhydrolase [Clostridia bacterium]